MLWIDIEQLRFGQRRPLPTLRYAFDTKVASAGVQ